MPANPVSELRQMKVVGASVRRLREGWQATLVREDEHGRECHDTFPLRTKPWLAWDDVFREAPEILEYGIVRIKAGE